MELPKHSGPERRASVRFPLALEVHSFSRRRREVGTRLGNMIDISSSGLRFATPGPLEPGRKLGVAIDWPVLLDGRVQLQLILAGTVVCSTGTETAIRIQRHEFRTRRTT
jgi:PilZ domain